MLPRGPNNAVADRHRYKHVIHAGVPLGKFAQKHRVSFVAATPKARMTRSSPAQRLTVSFRPRAAA